MPIQEILEMKLPVKLDAGKKAFIKQSFFQAADNMGEEEFAYIRRKINSKLDITKNAATAWIVRLSSYYEILYQVLKNNTKSNPQISSKSLKLIAVALFYFINPYDIIPDFTPGIGYVDDLHVLITCVKSLNNRDRAIVEKYFRGLRG